MIGVAHIARHSVEELLLGALLQCDNLNRTTLSRNFDLSFTQQIDESWRLLNKYFAHIARGVASAILQNGHLCADFAHHRHLVGNGNNGDPKFFIEAHEQLEDFISSSGVKGRCGFIA